MLELKLVLKALRRGQMQNGIKGSVPSGQPHPAISAMYEGKGPKECVCKNQWIEVYENVIQRGARFHPNW